MYFMTSSSSTFLKSLTEKVIGVVKGDIACIYAGSLAQTVIVAGDADTLRDLLQMIFFYIGVEVEYSGKNEHERGVIIDLDEDRLAEWGFTTHNLRFGETVIRASHSDIEIFDNKADHGKHLGPEIRYIIDELITNILRNGDSL